MTISSMRDYFSIWDCNALLSWRRAACCCVTKPSSTMESTGGRKRWLEDKNVENWLKCLLDRPASEFKPTFKKELSLQELWEGGTIHRGRPSGPWSHYCGKFCGGKYLEATTFTHVRLSAANISGSQDVDSSNRYLVTYLHNSIVHVYVEIETWQISIWH